MKLHRHLIIDIIRCLQTIFKEGRHADKAIEKALKTHPKWGSKDRKFFAESVYEIVRNWRLLWFCLNEKIDYKKGSLDDDSLFEIFGVWWFLAKGELLSFPELKNLKKDRITGLKEKASASVKILESFPDELETLIGKELGSQADLIMKALNQKAEVVLRTNTLKTDPKNLQDKLMVEDIVTDVLGMGTPEGLILRERKNVFITKAFKGGLFEVQDGSSQQVAHFMRVEPGMRVVDACAGAGGKTLHIAALMKNKGKIIAMDTEDYKLQELKIRLRRAGVDIVETRVIDSTKAIKRLHDSSDRVLLDVPCTGLGVIKRNPDTKWKFTLERLEELIKIQREILMEYSKMVKKGGNLIYSTCSILPSENKKQVEWFLGQSENKWEYIEDLTLLPHLDRFDGFYMARLKRLV